MSTVGHELHHVQRHGVPVGAVIRPATWQEALTALHDRPDARPVAGGTDLLLDLARTDGAGAVPVTLVDLSAIEGGRSIEETDDHLILGGGVTHNQIVGDRRFVDHALPLAQACLEIGSPQLRNRATLAGNLATASPANDSISALMALGATLELQVQTGSEVATREVAVADFFRGFRSTVLEPGELITGLRVPKLTDRQQGIWVKLGLRRSQAISVVHAGMVLTFDTDGVVVTALLALGSVAATVVPSPAFASALEGRRLEGSTIDAAASVVAAEIEPIDDVRATADYRRAATATVVARALRAIAAGEERAQWPTDPPLLGIRTPSSAPSSAVVDDQRMITATVNGDRVAGDHAAGTTLLDWLRDHSSNRAPGVKEGCAEGECGACTVQLDGAAAMSCLVPAAQVDGAEIVTVEGLAANGQLSSLQEAFISEFAVQCGFCIPGFLVAGDALIGECGQPTDEQIHLGLSGNLCRCTGYYPIAQAMRTGAAGASS